MVLYPIKVETKERYKLPEEKKLTTTYRHTLYLDVSFIKISYRILHRNCTRMLFVHKFKSVQRNELLIVICDCELVKDLILKSCV